MTLPRRVAGLVLLAWLAVMALVEVPVDAYWPLQATFSAVLCGCAALHLWRTGAQAEAALRRLAWPAVAVAAALVSLGLALWTRPAGWPTAELLRFAGIGTAHALNFLALLALLPGPEEGRTLDRTLWRALLVLLVAIVAGQIAAQILRGDGSTRMAGSLGNPNVLAAVLGACWIALCGLLQWRPWALLATAPLLPLLLTTRSRGGVAALAVVLLVLALRWRKRRFVALVVLGAVALVAVPNPLRERLALLQPEHSFGRPFVWAAAAERALDEPFGIGPGMNRYVFPAVAHDPARPWLLHQRHEIGLTHNFFLTVGLEWGWLAAAAVIGLGLLAGRRLLRARRGDDVLRHAATLGAAVLLVSMQADALEQNFVGFSFFVLLLALALARCPAGTRRPALPRHAAALVAALVAAAFMASALDTTRFVRAARAAEAQIAAVRQGEADIDRVRAQLAELSTRWPTALRPLRARFNLEHEQLQRLIEAGRPPGDGEVLEAFAEALAANATARALNALDYQLPRQAARVALRMHRHSNDPAHLGIWLVAMQVMLELDPLDVEGRWELAREAYRLNRTALADSNFEHLVALEPDQAVAFWFRARLRQSRGDLAGALADCVRADEALWNARQKQAIGSKASQAYYRRIVDGVDLAALRARKQQLRRDLYF